MRKFAIIVLVLTGTVVGLYKWSFPTVSYRYRLTIAVETDGQVHSGSSVIEVQYQFNPQFLWPIGGMYNFRLRGQAVLIDLGKRGALLASLGKYTDPNAVSAVFLAGRAFQPLARQSGGWYAATPERVRELSQMQGSAALTPDNLPLFIWLADIANTGTAHVVKLADFARVIGDGARLASAQVEITQDALTIDLDRRLPWYGTLKANNRAVEIDGLLFGAGSFIGSGVMQ